MVTFTLRSRCFFKKLKEFGDEFEITKLQEIFEKLFFIMFNVELKNKERKCMGWGFVRSI